ncbi:MAG: PaaI family thioesterase [Actinomycetota bacterium]
MKHPEGTDPVYDDARIALGAAVRRLGHAVIGHEVDLATMIETTAHLDRISETFESETPRSREFSQFSTAHDQDVPDHSLLTSHISRPGSGPGSPHGLEMVVHRRGDRIEAAFTLGASHEGAPQRSHGGIVALAFDDAMGFVLNVIKVVAYTGQITVRYTAPTPLHEPLVITAWLDRREGRKLFLEAELRLDRPDGPVLATSSALFIAIERY